MGTQYRTAFIDKDLGINQVLMRLNTPTQEEKENLEEFCRLRITNKTISRNPMATAISMSIRRPIPTMMPATKTKWWGIEKTLSPEEYAVTNQTTSFFKRWDKFNPYLRDVATGELFFIKG